MFDLEKGKNKVNGMAVDGWTNANMKQVQQKEMDTLPSFRADAGEALVVFRFLTYATVLTGSGAAGGQQGLTVFTWQKETKHRIA